MCKYTHTDWKTCVFLLIAIAGIELSFCISVLRCGICTSISISFISYPFELHQCNTLYYFVVCYILGCKDFSHNLIFRLLVEWGEADILWILTLFDLTFHPLLHKWQCCVQQFIMIVLIFSLFHLLLYSSYHWIFFSVTISLCSMFLKMQSFLTQINFQVTGWLGACRCSKWVSSVLGTANPDFIQEQFFIM